MLVEAMREGTRTLNALNEATPLEEVSCPPAPFVVEPQLVESYTENKSLDNTTLASETRLGRHTPQATSNVSTAIGHTALSTQTPQVEHVMSESAVAREEAEKIGEALCGDSALEPYSSPPTKEPASPQRPLSLRNQPLSFLGPNAIQPQAHGHESH